MIDCILKLITFRFNFERSFNLLIFATDQQRSRITYKPHKLFTIHSITYEQNEKINKKKYFPNFNDKLTNTRTPIINTLTRGDRSRVS